MQEPPKKPILKKPPGYKDPNASNQPPTHTPTKPVLKKPSLLPSLQNNNNNNNYKRRPLPPLQHRRRPTLQRRNWCGTCCCCIFLTFLLIILTLGIITTIFYLWFNPQLPIFQLKPITIDNFNTTSIDGLTYLNSRATVWLQVKNPNNKLTVYYGDMESTLLTEEETELGYSSKPGFRQGIRNVTVLKYVVRVDKMEIDTVIAKRLKSRVKSKVVRLRVEVMTRIGFGVIGKKGRIGRMLPIGVNCGGENGISLKQLVNGRRSPKCKIDLFRWMKING